MIRAGRITSAVLGAMLVLFAVSSGGIYPWARDLFFIAAFILMALCVASGGASGLSLVALLPAGVAALSALWTINLNNTVSQALQLFSFGALAVSASSLSEKDGRDFVLKCLLAAAGAVSLYAVYQYFAGFAHTEELLREAAGRGGPADGHAARILEYRRAFSTFLSPNALACYLAAVFPVGLSYSFSGGRFRPLYFALLGPMLAALFLAKSVGGFAALATGVLLFFLLSRRHGRGLKKAPYLLAVGLVLLAAGYGVMKYRSSGGDLGVGRSAGQRAAYWAGAAAMAKESPVLGHGAGSFEILYPGYIKPGGDETRYAHNVFLQTAAETGALGVLALAALAAVFFMAGLRRGTGEDDIVFTGILSGGAAFLVANQFDFSFYVQESSMPFWLFWGLVAGDGYYFLRRQKLASLRQFAVAKITPVPGFAILIMLLFPLYFYINNYLAGQKKDEALALLRESGITSSSSARANPAPPEAVSLAEEAVRLKGYDDGLHAFLAGLYEGRASVDGPESLKKAESEYRKAIAFNPKYPFYYKDLGLLYLRAGDKDRAAESFRHALSLYPESATFKKYLFLAEN